MDPSSSLDDFTEKSSPLEAAKMHASLAFTLNSLFFAYLKTKGQWDSGELLYVSASSRE